MRELATFERETTGGDDIDGTTGGWETLFKEYVNLTPLTGRELLVAAQIQSQATHTGEIHWSPETVDLKASDRFKIGNRVFNLESVLNEKENNRKLVLMCIEEL